MKPAYARPIRIALVHSERCVLECIELILRSSLKYATLAMFENSSTAWDYLARNDADVVFMTDPMPVLRSEAIAEMLVARKAGCSIVVMSGYMTANHWARKYPRIGPNISFLSMPFTVAEFRECFDAALQASKRFDTRDV